MGETGVGSGGATSRTRDRRERVDFSPGKVIWCFRRSLGVGRERSGGSEKGCAACLISPVTGVAWGELKETIVVVIMGYLDGTTTLAAGNPRRIRSALGFRG
jgi:hypothetical protein